MKEKAQIQHIGITGMTEKMNEKRKAITWKERDG